MSQVSLFYCAYYFDNGAKEFILHAIYSDEQMARDSLLSLPPEIKSRHVISATLEAIKRSLLKQALADAVAVAAQLAPLAAPQLKDVLNAVC